MGPVLLVKSLTWSGYPLQGREKFQGMDISIENRAGSTRSGVDADGHEWHTKMLYPYGYIRGTVGVDKDHVDAYLGPDRGSKLVYVIHQINPDNGRFDEDKVMLGFSSAKEAKKAYLIHYDRPDFFGSMERFTVDEFKKLAFSRKGQKITRARLNGVKLLVSSARNDVKKAIDRSGLQLLPTYAGGKVVYRWQNPNKEDEINSKGKRRDSDIAAFKDNQAQQKMFDDRKDAGQNQFDQEYQKIFQHRIKPILATVSKVDPKLVPNFQRKYQNYKFDNDTLNLDLKLDEMTAQYMEMVHKERSGPKKEQGLFGDEETSGSAWDEFLEKSKRLAQEINARKREAMRIKPGDNLQTPFGVGRVAGFTARGFPRVVVKGVEHSMFYDEIQPEHEAKLLSKQGAA